MRLRAGRRLAQSAGGKPLGEPGWKPGGAGWRWLRALLCHHSPQVPAPGSHLSNHCLDGFRRPKAKPQPERRVHWSLKRAPKRSPSILWACAVGSETGGWRQSGDFLSSPPATFARPGRLLNVLNNTPTGPSYQFRAACSLHACS